MSVVLRAASGQDIGLGHAMRSWAVAQEIVRLGGRARLIVDDVRTARSLPTDSRLGLEVLTAEEKDETDHASVSTAWFDGFRDWSEELDPFAKAGVPAVLVENRTEARPRADRLLYPALHHVDDEWDRAHPERVLSGPAWIPLRSAVVSECTATERDVDLLVTFGGSDPRHLTERVLRLLAGDERVIVVAVGALMESRRAVLTTLLGFLPNATLLSAGAELASWMARSRTAVTALGTTLCELAYHRVPAGILANYSEDSPALAWYSGSEHHVPIGVAEEVTDAQLFEALQSLQGERLRDRPGGLGLGARRLAHLLVDGFDGLGAASDALAS